MLKRSSFAVACAALAIPSIALLSPWTARASSGESSAAAASRLQDGLPDAPGKDVVEAVCTTCHGIDYMTGTHLTVPGWKDTLDLMKAFGATASDEEWTTVEAYIIANLAHLEVNKAAAGDIALVFAIDERAADDVVAYRQKQGAFKSIDDLKKAPGVDAGRIDAVQVRLMFD